MEDLSRIALARFSASRIRPKGIHRHDEEQHARDRQEQNAYGVRFEPTAEAGIGGTRPKAERQSQMQPRGG